MKEGGMPLPHDEEKGFMLSPHDVGFIKHFIRSYEKNFHEGDFKGAHHDATAILLELKRLLGLSCE